MLVQSPLHSSQAGQGSFLGGGGGVSKLSVVVKIYHYYTRYVVFLLTCSFLHLHEDKCSDLTG